MKKLIPIFILLFTTPVMADLNMEQLETMRKEESRSRATKDFSQREFERKKIGGAAQLALNSMVKRANKALKQKGFKNEAKTLQAEWDQNFSTAVVSVRFDLPMEILEVGDFEPMWQWLDDFYGKLVKLLGQDLVSGLKLDDIWTINRAMKVTFFPRDTRWDEPEYLLHFKPFTEIVFYWIAMGGCSAANFALTEKLICSPIALGLRGIGGMISKPIGGLIWNATHK